jgi:hypothetical protein
LTRDDARQAFVTDRVINAVAETMALAEEEFEGAHPEKVFLEYRGGRWDRDLATFKIKEGCKEIEDNAFSHCLSVENLDGIRGSAVTKIGKNAFEGCNALRTIQALGESQVTEIGDRAFYVCRGLESIDGWPKKVSSIGKGMFALCWSLKHVTIPVHVIFIDENAFGSNKTIDSFIILNVANCAIHPLAFGERPDKSDIFFQQEQLWNLADEKGMADAVQYVRFKSLEHLMRDTTAYDKIHSEDVWRVIMGYLW